MSTGKVLFTYHPREVDELFIEVGEVVDLFNLNEDGWWLAKKGDDVGLVPGNYVYCEEIDKYNASHSEKDYETYIPNDNINQHQGTEDLRRIKQLRLQEAVTIESLR